MTTKIQTFGGNIGIGTTDPGDFKLNVHGSLKTSSLVVNGVTNAQVPIGLLGMWSGSFGSIPSGWALCDGDTYTRTDGGGSIATPDLREKFIRGADGNAPSPVATGTVGGQNNATLSAANLASHSHGVTVDAGNANHNHNTDDSNMLHGHPRGNTQTPHSHGETSTTNTAHVHGTPAPLGWSGYSSKQHTHSANNANMPHDHNTSYTQIPHAHNTLQIVSSFGGPGPNIYGTRSQGTKQGTLNTPSAGAGPHSHSGQNTTPQHTHGCPSTPGIHSHNTGSDNWTHSHAVTSRNANHSHNTGDGNAPHSHTVNAVDAPHAHNASSNNTGQATSFSVLNAYYALFYIMKI